jgi:hypothetical protein
MMAKVHRGNRRSRAKEIVRRRGLAGNLYGP